MGTCENYFLSIEFAHGKIALYCVYDPNENNISNDYTFDDDSSFWKRAYFGSEKLILSKNFL